MNNKFIHIITTYKCSACKCIEAIIKDIQKENHSFEIISYDFNDAPAFIKRNINLTDFPTVVFIENDIIKYHFIGTLSKKKIKNIMKDINF